MVQRLSTYNKLEDHEVIYYKAFIDEEQMKTAEDMVLKKLHQYKEIECRDSQENNSNYFLERHKILNINLIFYWATDLFYQLVKILSYLQKLLMMLIIFLIIKYN